MRKRFAPWYVFSLGADFSAVAAGHGLEARATAAKSRGLHVEMAATRWYFARLNTYAPVGAKHGGFSRFLDVARNDGSPSVRLV